MKRILFILTFLFFLAGCGSQEAPAPIAATTLPVYEFTSRICAGTGLEVVRLVTEEVSCLHDYSLNVRQVKKAEAAETIVISGAGLEGFLDGLLVEDKLIDASQGLHLLSASHSRDHGHNHDHEEAEEDSHGHGEYDPHIWLSPKNAMQMAQNICDELTLRYPEHEELFRNNTGKLISELEELDEYGQKTLSSLSCRELITFHDGFSYFAHSFDLTILEAVEEESGSEASARDLIHLIEEVEHHKLPAIFTEVSGSDSAASIIARETGAGCFALDMAMSGDSYFTAMYHNIQTIKEALQ